MKILYGTDSPGIEHADHHSDTRHGARRGLRPREIEDPAHIAPADLDSVSHARNRLVRPAEEARKERLRVAGCGVMMLRQQNAPGSRGRGVISQYGCCGEGFRSEWQPPYS